MAWFVVFLTLTLLILVSALYVAAEFSTVSARRSRLAELAEGGNPLATALLPIVRDPHQLDTYIATCQLGITASNLLLGFYGQAQLTPVIAPYLVNLGRFSQVAAVSIASSGVLIVLTVVQVVLGELVPKSIGLQYPEQMALVTSVPTRWSIIFFKPLIWIFNGSGQLLLRLFGKQAQSEHVHLHSPQEIMILFEESSAGGLLDSVERRLLRNSLELRRLAVRQVMIPRTRMLAATADQPCEELLALLANSPFSRLPVYEESIDNIVGFVHLKDLLCLQLQTGQHDVRQAMRPVLNIPETMPVDEVFSILQDQRLQVAIVLDEFGGTSGIVTIEDLIEEIFGELEDEFDLEAQPAVKILSDNRVQVRGDMLIDELNEIMDLDLPSAGVDTLGGLVLSLLGHVPVVGERVKFKNTTLFVDVMDGKGVSAVSMEITPDQLQHLKDWLG